jgi:hypothetical protein
VALEIKPFPSLTVKSGSDLAAGIQ